MNPALTILSAASAFAGLYYLSVFAAATGPYERRKLVTSITLLSIISIMALIASFMHEVAA